MDNAVNMRLEEATIVASIPPDRHHRYNPLTGWWYFTGTHWEMDRSKSEIAATIALTIENIREAYSKAEGVHDSVRKAANSYYKLTATRIKQVLSYLELLPSYVDENIGINPPEWLINTKAGVLDLRSGEVSEHSPNYNFTTIVDAEYTPEKASERWQSFLDSSLPNPDVQKYLQETLGYALTGDRRHENILLFSGSGRNGKGVLLQTISEILGNEPMAVTTDPSVFNRGTGSARFGTARWVNARFIIVTELGAYTAGGSRTTEMLKSIAGGDRITAEHKGKPQFDFQPKGLVVISTNNRPSFTYDDDAFWARVRSIYFPNSYIGREDPTLKPDLIGDPNNRNVIFTWLVDGARAVIERDRNSEHVPMIVKAQTEEMRSQTDNIYRFVSQMLDSVSATDEDFIANETLYNMYLLWCKEEHVRETSRALFLDRVERYTDARRDQLSQAEASRRNLPRQRVVFGIKWSEEAREAFSLEDLFK